MTDHLILRQADPAERAMLESLQLRASLAWEEHREALLADPDSVELPLKQIEESRVCVAQADGEILGFSVVLPRVDGDVELDGLFVEPRAWRKGIGRALVEEALRRAVLEGAWALHVVANPRAEQFYVACGFETTGETQTRFGIALIMRRASGAAL